MSKFGYGINGEAYNRGRAEAQEMRKINAKREEHELTQLRTRITELEAELEAERDRYGEGLKEIKEIHIQLEAPIAETAPEQYYLDRIKETYTIACSLLEGQNDKE
jgi:chromosome segregation ATPase